MIAKSVLVCFCEIRLLGYLFIALRLVSEAHSAKDRGFTWILCSHAR